MIAYARRLWHAHGRVLRTWFVPATFVIGLCLCCIALAKLLAGADVAFAIEPLHVTVASALLLVFVSASTLAWRSFLAGMGGPLLDRIEALHQVGLVLVGKYVPGKVSGVAARVFANHGRCNAGTVVAATFVEQIGSLAMACLWGFAFFVEDAWQAVSLLFAMLLSLGLAPRMVVALQPRWSRLAAATARLNVAVLQRGFLHQFVVWAVLSLMVVVVADMASPGTSATALFRLAGAYAAALVAGQLAFVFPGGIGPREGVFVWLGSGIIPTQDALAVALALRLVTSLADLLGAVGFVAHRHRAKASAHDDAPSR